MKGAVDMIEAAQQYDHLSQYGDKILITGATGTVVFGYTLSEIGLMCGIMISILGFLMSWWYKHKAYQMRRVLFNKQMDELSGDEDVSE